MTWAVADLLAQLKRLPADARIVSTDFAPLEDIYLHMIVATDELVVVIQFEEKGE